jgi:hypothetical protein
MKQADTQDSNAVVGEVSPTFIYLQESLFSSMSTPQDIIV